MHWTPRRERFRAILAGGRCIHPASVFDPMSARIAQDLGFEMGMFAGSTGSLAVLGAPDLVVLTLTEFAEQALRINRAVADLPLMVDADHGYGNALNVKRTVEELETVGVSALTIEDTALPQPFGSGGRPSLLPVEEGVGKMRAALAGRQDKALVVVGRTSAPSIAGIEEAVARARAYADAGVDAVFLSGVKSRAEVEALSAAVRLPLILGNTTADIRDPEFLARHGVAIALQGHQPIMAAVRAVHETMKALRDGTPPEKLAGLPSKELMQQVTRDADYARWTTEFLGG